MLIFPAIDLKDGAVVRLYKGDFATVHQVADDPLASGPVDELMARLHPATAPHSAALADGRAVFSNRRARTELGWNPTKTSFEDLVRIMVEHDMRKVAVERAGDRIRCNLEEYLEKGVVK